MPMAFILLLCVAMWSPLQSQNVLCINKDGSLPYDPGPTERTTLQKGDLNNDGYEDLVGYTRYGSSLLKIFYGSASGLQNFVEINLGVGYYETNTIIPGDINNDGFDDIITGGIDSMYVFYGSASGITPVPDQRIRASQIPLDNSKQSLVFPSISGDINKDGIDDLIAVVNSSFDNVNGNLVFYYGTPQGLIYDHKQTGSQFDIFRFDNIPLENLGDANGDGNNDFINANNIFYLTDEGIFSNTITKINDPSPGDNWKQSGVGDVNGDGYNDVLSTGQEYNFNQQTASIFLGGPGGVNPNPSFGFINPYFSFNSNEWVLNSGPAGDVNNDGLDDFFITGFFETRIYLGKAGGPTVDHYIRLGYPINNLISLDYNNDQRMDLAAKISELYLFNGTANGLNGIVSCGVSAAQPSLSIAGKNAKKAGDINKDGFDDYIVGDPFVNSYEDDYQNEFNRASVYLGNATGGVLNMQFNRTDELLGEQQVGADINGDGYSDIILGAEASEPGGKIYVFPGSPTGVKSVPDIILDGMNFRSLGSRVFNFGDINNDGFDDIGASSEVGFLILAGSPDNFNLDNRIEIQGLTYALPLGDVNADGIEDILVSINNSNKLYLGNSNGPQETSYTFPSNVIVERMDDLNKDGKADLIFYNPANLVSTLYYSTGTDFISSGWSVTGNKIPVRAGDFNGDGFQDIMHESELDNLIIEGANSRIDIYPGSAVGFSTEPSLILRNPYDLVAPSELGDINNDGSSDIGAYNRNEILIFFGTKGQGSLICPANITFYADSTCKSVVTNIDPPGNISQFKFEITGSTNLTGDGSASGLILNQGLNFIKYIDKSNDQNFCSFVVTILDSIAPMIKGSEETFCNANPNFIRVQNLNVSDCGKTEVTFEVRERGFLIRSGTGIDASGEFRFGRNDIYWTVTDSSGNISKTSSIINVLSGNLTVKIPKAYQINAQQSQEFIIYMGYANNTLRLTAYEANSSKHKYRWTNGDTTRYTYVRHNVPGRYKYSVFVTNDNGCRARADVFVKVVDNYCPNTDNIYMCYNGSTICVSPDEVPAMVANGARLGKCGRIYESNDHCKRRIKFSRCINAHCLPEPKWT
jgi:hypothetical protein